MAVGFESRQSERSLEKGSGESKMREQQKMAPNYYAYSENREVFKVTRSTLQITTGCLDNGLSEVRELYLTAVTESKKLRDEFASVVFRIVESTHESPTDKEGNSIVGGVNSYPEPVHVVLFVSADVLALLNQRHACGRCLITIYTGTSLLEWDREGSVPIYQSNLLAVGN